MVIPCASIGIVRRHYIVAIAPLPPIPSVHEIVSEPFVHLADNGLAHARVDPLTLTGAIAMAQGSERMKYHRRGNCVIGPGATGLARRTAGIALRVEHADEAAGHRTPANPFRRFKSGFTE